MVADARRNNKKHPPCPTCKEDGAVVVETMGNAHVTRDGLAKAPIYLYRCKANVACQMWTQSPPNAEELFARFHLKRFQREHEGRVHVREPRLHTPKRKPYTCRVCGVVKRNHVCKAAPAGPPGSPEAASRCAPPPR